MAFERVDAVDVILLHAEALANLAEHAEGVGVLTAGHAGGAVVEDEHRDRSVLVDGIQQGGHAAVGEGGVTDDRHAGAHAGIRGTLGHRDGGAHVNGGVDGVVGRKGSEGVAADVGEDLALAVFLHRLVEGGVGVDVRAADAQGRRTRNHEFRNGGTVSVGQTEGFGDQIRVQLAITRKFAAETAHDVAGAVQHAAHLLLDEGVAFLGDEHLLALIDHLGDELRGQRVLGNLQHGVRTFAALEVLHQVVVGDTGSDDT